MKLKSVVLNVPNKPGNSILYSDFDNEIVSFDEILPNSHKAMAYKDNFVSDRYQLNLIVNKSFMIVKRNTYPKKLFLVLIYVLGFMDLR